MFNITKTSFGQLIVTGLETIGFYGGVALWFSVSPLAGTVFWFVWTYLEHAYAEYLVRKLVG